MHHWGFVQCWGLNPGRPSHTLGKYSQLGYHLQPWGKLCFQEFLSSRNLHLLKLARLQESHPSQWSSQRWRLGPLRTVALLPRATPVREIKQGLGHTGRLPRGLAGAPPSPPSSQTKHHPPSLRPRPSPWSAILSGFWPPTDPPLLSPKIPGCPSRWYEGCSPQAPGCPSPHRSRLISPRCSRAPLPRPPVTARSRRFPDGGWAAAVRTRRTGRRGKAGGGAQGGRGAPGNGPRPRHRL